MATQQELPSDAVLLELRNRLEAARREMLSEYRADFDRERAIPVDETGDVADRAGAALDREDLFAEVESDRDRLAEIDDALRRIDAGAYGICEAGGEAIPLARLRAVPWARRCVAHEAEAERTGGEADAGE